MRIVIVSGGFDPVHVGHLRLFKEAKKHGDKLIVIVNSDDFLLSKKGYFAESIADRLELIDAFECVDEVFPAIDTDQTVCESLKVIARDYKGNYIIFANGGDRFEDDVPEKQVCEDHKIRMVFNVGGGKVNSSSEIIKGILEREAV